MFGLKFNVGSITNPKTNETKEVIVKAASPVPLKIAIIGAASLWLTMYAVARYAFVQGAYKLAEAEDKTLADLDLLSGVVESAK